jgi:hypothetical protein
MLFNYCLALRHAGRCDEAAEVALHVIRTWGHREGSADMHMFVAIEEALARNVTAAKDHLERLVVRQNVLYDRQIHALTKALVDLQTAPAAERRRAFAAVRDRLETVFSGYGLARSSRDIRRTFARSGEVFAREAGFRAWWWSKWNLHWQWSLVPLIVPVVALVIAVPQVLYPFAIVYLVTRASRRG